MQKISGFSDEIGSDIQTQFEVLNKLGIPYFEPRGINGKNISVLNDNEVIQLKNEMEKYNVKASSIGSPVGKIKISDNFEAHFEMFKRVVKTAKMLETKYIRIFSFYNDKQEWDEAARLEVFRRLKHLISYAKENDIILLHENEKDVYGDVQERCVDLMQEFYGDNFKAVFDPANFVQCGESVKEAFESLRPYVAYMHIKDAEKESGKVVPAGVGDGEIPYILGSLYASGYDGFISLEPHLGSFEGLEALELDDSMLALPKSGEGTFTVAFRALQTILNHVGGER